MATKRSRRNSGKSKKRTKLRTKKLGSVKTLKYNVGVISG